MIDTAQEEAALWEQFRQGNQQVLAILFERFYERLVLYGYKLTTDKTMAEDCAQELFVDLLHKKQSPPVDFVRAYLFKSLRYKIIRASERLKTRQRHEQESEQQFLLQNLETDSSDPAAEARRQHLIQSVDSLSHRQREIIYLRFYQNLSYDEIAQVMDLNYQTSRNLLHKAIRSLREKME